MHRHIITCKELNVQTDKANLILTDAYTLLQSALNISSFPSYYVIILLRLILWNCKIRYARDEWPLLLLFIFCGLFHDPVCLRLYSIKL
jgi:hypothetical protein